MQASFPRTAEETKKEVDIQLHLAALGVKDHVDKRQTESGIKDSVAQGWIEKLLVRGHQLHQKYITNPNTCDKRLKNKHLTGAARHAVREEIFKKIKKEQREWLVQQPPHRYEALPENSSKLTENDRPH